MQPEDPLALLGSHTKLDRERACEALSKQVKESSGAKADAAVVKGLLDLIQEEKWEARHGALLAVGQLAREGALSEDQALSFVDGATSALEHHEFRVRMEGAACLGSLCTAFGPVIYEGKVASVVTQCITENMTRRVTEEELRMLREKLGVRADASADAVMYESAGWKTLDTGFKALLEVIKGCGVRFRPHMTSELLDIVFQGLSHINRFVRETGYFACAEIVDIITPGSDEESGEGITYEEFAPRMATQLAIGLSDNWSQVRMATSVATRRFLLAMDEEKRHDYFPQLLPKMCLNRYYVAAGVRIYSQETWATITQGDGPALVAKYIDETVDFYISQSQADNHAVREAACACIAELGNKVSQDALRPHVQRLLECLLGCFEDDSWPVRDAACIASGRFLGCFKEESKQYLAQFMDRFYHHLSDNIWSVRQNAAIAISAVAGNFEEVLPEIEKVLNERILAAKDQKEDSKQFSGLENATQFGVAKPTGIVRFSQQDTSHPDAHTDQQMYSCGSLAPKLKKSGGGCMNCAYAREQEPWEKSDGCVYLLAALSEKYPETVTPFIAKLAELTAFHHYKHHYNLLETVWKQFPALMKNVKKSAVKSVLEDLIPSLSYSLKGDHQLSRVAAEECVRDLAALIGKSILKGRVDMYVPDDLPLYERIIA